MTLNLNNISLEIINNNFNDNMINESEFKDSDSVSSDDLNNNFNDNMINESEFKDSNSVSSDDLNNISINDNNSYTSRLMYCKADYYECIKNYNKMKKNYLIAIDKYNIYAMIKLGIYYKNIKDNNMT
jgi:hypothetical protein